MEEGWTQERSGSKQVVEAIEEFLAAMQVIKIHFLSGIYSSVIKETLPHTRELAKGGGLTISPLLLLGKVEAKE